jgi:hypothetical protein
MVHPETTSSGSVDVGGDWCLIKQARYQADIVLIVFDDQDSRIGRWKSAAGSQQNVFPTNKITQ